MCGIFGFYLKNSDELRSQEYINRFKSYLKKLSNMYFYFCKFGSKILGTIKTKKEYKVRMAPTIFIIKNGTVEASWKAGLDLELPTDLEEIQESINEINNASKF